MTGLALKNMKKFKFLIILIAVAVLVVSIESLLPVKAWSAASKNALLSPLGENEQKELLASHVMPLNNRYPVKSVSDVFRDNILLTLYYMSGKVSGPTEIKWDEVRGPSRFEFELKPGEVFAFHEDVLPEYQGKVALTTKAHFNAADGFLTDGFLYGDGVCHLASVMNWVGQGAGLKVEARVNHNFANIPDVPMQYGTAIFFSPGSPSIGQQQNLYIENTLDKPIKFVFEYENEELKVSVFR